MWWNGLHLKEHHWFGALLGSYRHTSDLVSRCLGGVDGSCYKMENGLSASILYGSCSSPLKHTVVVRSKQYATERALGNLQKTDVSHQVDHRKRQCLRSRTITRYARRSDLKRCILMPCNEVISYCERRWIIWKYIEGEGRLEGGLRRLWDGNQHRCLRIISTAVQEELRGYCTRIQYITQKTIWRFN